MQIIFEFKKMLKQHIRKLSLQFSNEITGQISVFKIKSLVI